MATMTKNEQKVLKDLIKLFDKVPIEVKYYLLGYAQSEADKNVNGSK